jgi:PKD repeat protein
MSAKRSACGSVKPLVATLALVGLLVGLAACRGFFGQGPMALLNVILPEGDNEAPIEATFDISSSTDPDGTIATYEVDFGDDSAAATGTDVADVILHTYVEGGNYKVTLTVTDNDGRIDRDVKAAVVGPLMIAFASDRGGDFDLYRMRKNGSDEGIVLDTARDELFPDLLRGTRDRIAYAAEDGTRWNVWTIRPDGTGQNQLTTQTASNQIQPSWSADATFLAYASNAAPTPSITTWEIWTMSDDGTSPTQLTTQSPSWAIAPACSPTGDYVAFVSDKTADGGSSLWLWEDAADSASELYDSAGRDGDTSAAGFSASLLTALGLPTGAGISKPAWSPSGDLLAFSRERTAGGIIDIYVIDVALGPTSAQSLEGYVNDRLAERDPPVAPVAAGSITSTNDEFSPYWLEDGSGLVFVRETAGDYQLYRVSFETGLATPALTTSGANVMPSSVR